MNLWLIDQRVARWMASLLPAGRRPLGIQCPIRLLQLVRTAPLISAMMVIDVLLVWVERKVVARFQDRPGPEPSWGHSGSSSRLPDIIKLLIKEDITPHGRTAVVYNLAPILSLMSVLLLWAIVPLAPVRFGGRSKRRRPVHNCRGGDWTLAIIMAGWASNNKYALIVPSVKSRCSCHLKCR